jgi:4-hydroxybenzoate polyprenyltransferase
VAQLMPGAVRQTDPSALAEAAEMIKFQHTVFALPFAVIALVTSTGAAWPSPWVWSWVLVAMVAARTAAMAFNRLVDAGIDAENPRTADRSLPAGRLSRTFVALMVAASVVLFFIAAGMLNRLCLLLAAPTLAVLLGYSYAKRFTASTHLWLGAALGLAPLGAWLAGSGRPAWPPVVLGTAVAVWVAGFDIIYSLQDEAFDRHRGLHSIPARLGARRALWVSRSLHLLAIVGFAVFAVLAGGGALRIGAVTAAAALLLWQHRLVAPNDLSRVDAAFFTANGLLSLAMGAAFVFAKMADA